MPLRFFHQCVGPGTHVVETLARRAQKQSAHTHIVDNRSEGNQHEFSAEQIVVPNAETWIIHRFRLEEIFCPHNFKTRVIVLLIKKGHDILLSHMIRTPHLSYIHENLTAPTFVVP